MRIARAPQLLLVFAAAAALLAGCGSSSNETAPTQGESSTTETAPPPQGTTSTAPAGAGAQSCPSSVGDTSELRATGTPCSLARATASAWGRVRTCSASKSSRYSCTIGQFRCQSATTDRGIAVSCAGPGRSISFIAKRD